MAPSSDPAVPARGRGLRRAGWIALVAAGALYSAHMIWGVGPTVIETVVYQGLLITAAVICVARAVVRRDERAAWSVIGTGLVLWAAADVYYKLVVIKSPEPPIPSVSDVGWLSYYPAMYIGLMLLLRSRGAHFSRSMWLDGAIGGLAIAAVGSAVVLGPVFAASEGSTFGEVATTLAYPLGDCVLLAIVIASFGLMGWRPGPRLLALGAGFALSAIADSLYAYRVAHGAFDLGISGIGYVASALMIAYASWRPAGTVQVDPVRRRMLVLPAVFTLAAVGVLVYDHFARITLLSLGLAAFALLLAVARFVATFGENIRMLVATRHESLTDSLTGLANRRSMVADLDGAFAAGFDEPMVLGLFDLDGFKRYNDTFGHPAGDQLLIRLSTNLRRALGDEAQAYRMGGDEFCVLAKAGSHTLLQQAAHAMSERGDAFDVTCSFGSVLIPEEASTPSHALSVADDRLYGRKNSRHNSSRSQARDVLVEALRERQVGLHEHSSGVATLSVAVGRRLHLGAEALDELARGAELHDVGKVAIPDAVLDKPSSLTEEEWGFMRRHTLIGESILSAAPALIPVARVVRSSHERWDGAGYPDGLKGEEIPLGARIVFAADAYSAMTSDRAYRSGMTHEEALDELRRCSGTQFDPTVIDAVLAELEVPRDRTPAAEMNASVTTPA
jgi:two-component system cell cycle response regulator